MRAAVKPTNVSRKRKDLPLKEDSKPKNKNSAHQGRKGMPAKRYEKVVKAPVPTLVREVPGIVAGGFSLRLPESDSAEEFWSNLIGGKDMVSEVPRNWDPKSLGVPSGYAKLKSYDKFDSQFFEVHPKQTEKLDPQIRLLLEVAYEAIVDACFNPKDLEGSNTGVFIGACGSDVMSNNCNYLDKMTGYENTGCALSMFANRISYHFNLKGPSMCVDTACSSSLTAFDLACKAILNGECDHALVGGSNFIFHPLWTVGFNKLNMLSNRCLSFNQDGKGFARAEGAVVIMISRENLSRKKYARVLTSHVSCDGYTKEGITFPDAPSQRALLRRVYRDEKVLDRLFYMETHGTGTVAGDPVELNSIEGVLFEEFGRKKPVHIGSVKSNMGHSEAASGLAGMAKVLLSMLHEQVPANLNCENFNKNIPGLHNGNLQAVSKAIPFKEGLASVSSFGFGGANAHVLLEKIPSPKVSTGPYYPIPFASRTEAGFGLLREQLSKPGVYTKASPLLTRLNHTSLPKNGHHGFVVFDKRGKQLADVKVNNPQENRPVWLVLNGVGAQWAGMGASLLEMPIANETLQRCHKHLSKHNVDLLKIITSDNEAFATPVHIFVGVASIQIALYHLLRALNIRIDGYFGHSLGELACAYIDGAVTFEQTLDIAYFRGLALVESKISGGSMVAVDMEQDQLEKELPSDLEIACYNGKENFTVAGPESSIVAFASRLTSLDVTNKVVNTGGIPFHSTYIHKARALFTEYLGKIVKTPKPRSAKWISSSREASQARRSDCADLQFFTQNLFEPVQFYRCMQQIPADAILLEVGPHGLFKSQFAANLPSCEYVSLMKRKDKTVESLWKGLGQLSCDAVPLVWSGLLPHLRAEYPLDRIENLVSWDHSTTWVLPEINLGKTGAKSDFIEDFVIDIETEEYSWVKDHIVNGNPIFPGMGYLHLVWLTIAKFSKAEPETVSVELQDIRFVRASIFRNTSSMKLTVKYDTVDKSFQVLEADQLVARGVVSSIGAIPESDADFSEPWTEGDLKRAMHRNDVYKLFVKTGIEYKNSFRGISCVSGDNRRALVDCVDQLPAFFDSVLQLFLVGDSAEGFGLPKSIDLFRFNPTKMSAKQTGVPVIIKPTSGSLHAPCLELEGLHTTPFVASIEDYVMCSVGFQPYCQSLPFSAEEKDYFNLCRDFTLGNLHQLIHQEGLSVLPPQIKDLDSRLGPLAPVDYSQALVEEQCKLPKAYMLRFLRHIFSNSAELLSNAKQVITSSPDFKDHVREDLLFSRRKQLVESMLEMVVRNSMNSAVIRCSEVGTNDGNLTAVALPLMCKYSTEYQLTDCSEATFADLKTEFAMFEHKTRYGVWDYNSNAPLDPASQQDLVLLSNCGSQRTIDNVARSLKEGGFFLVHQYAQQCWYPNGVWGLVESFVENDLKGQQAWIASAAQAGLELVMIREVGDLELYLLFRKLSSASASLQTVSVPDITVEENFTALQSTLDRVPAGGRIWLIGHDSVVPGLDGFVRTLAVEASHINIRGLLIKGSKGPSSEEIAHIQRLDMISNVWEDDSFGSYFQTPWESKSLSRNGAATKEANYKVCVTVPGDLSTIRLAAVEPLPVNPAASKSGFKPVDVHVKYFSLNFKDAMLASGRISSKNAKPVFGEPIGMEYAGVLEDGTQVMGMCEMGVSGIMRVEKAQDLWRVPKGMSLREACTIPVAYATAVTAIVFKAHARPGQSIFIHSGAGAVGQAAICISLHLGLDVFTTVSSDSKRDFLCERFPLLKRQQIFDSRTTQFKSDILEATSGKGVDIVLNSFSGEKLAKSMDAIAKYGQFVDISRYDAFHNNTLPMRAFLKNLTYSSFFLDEIFKDGHPDADLVHKWIQEALDQQEIIPLHHAESSDIAESIQTLLKGNTIGKIVINLPECQAKLKTVDAFTCSASKAYVVTGGFGGIGLELLEWLASRGAKDLVVVTRSRTLNPHQTLVISKLKNLGVKVEVSNVDLMQEKQAIELMSQLESQGRHVGGVFHLAMVLRDRILANLSYEDFFVPIAVKISIGRNLDLATRRHCPQLEQFVMFSSVICFYGNMGQTSYALGNSSLERLVEQRSKDSLPGVAIQVGAVGDVGFLAAEGREDMVSRLGLEPMKSSSFIDSLDHLLLGNFPVVSAHAALRLKMPSKASRQKNLVADVLAIMGFQTIPPKEMHSKSLVELGVDSLMVVEINQVLSRDYNIRLSPKQIRQLTLEKINEMSGSDNAGPSKPAVQDQVTQPPICVSIHDPIPRGTFNAAYYYVDGFFLDPAANLPLIEKAHKTAAYFFIPYHDGVTDLEVLSQLFVKHLSSLPGSVSNVTLCGFSFGSLVAARLGAAGKAVRNNLTVKAFAVPKGFATILDGLVPLSKEIASPENKVQSVTSAIDVLMAENNNTNSKVNETLKAKVFAATRTVFGDFENGHTLQYADMLNELKFLDKNRETLSTQPLQAFDEVYSFLGDSFSLSKDSSIPLSTSGAVFEVQRAHSPTAVTF